MKLRFPKLAVWQWCVLVAGAIAVAAGGIALLRVMSVAELVDRIASLGPWPLFVGLAILPAFGAPVSPFYLLAGASLELELAIPLVIGGLSANVALSYLMARWMLRPFVVRVVKWLGYDTPVVRPEDRWGITLLVRITPGPPFFVQSYLLGLASVPFAIYMLVSVLVASFFAVGMVLFGESLMHGRTGLFVLAACVLIAAFVALRLVRNMMRRRQAGGSLEQDGPTSGSPTGGG